MGSALAAVACFTFPLAFAIYYTVIQKRALAARPSSQFHADAVFHGQVAIILLSFLILSSLLFLLYMSN